MENSVCNILPCVCVCVVTILGIVFVITINVLFLGHVEKEYLRT